ncbi:hypothetical protein [Spirosoma validum]|uniref:Uncharacterized protein n=1 Tax=Spirosoma validum TaxID=2771355 RepID=A0A927GCG6_9BACT|nr:hypothetical protein [Spirosoma validum]MBD2752618.1 hypothetical protein [Spirosoma validum]
MNADQTSQNPPLRQLTAQEFIDVLTEVDRERYAEYYERMIDYPIDATIIRGVEITDHVKLDSNIEVALPLFIQDSAFHRGISIEGGKFINELQFDNVAINFLVISGGIFNGIEILSGSFGSTRIRGGTFNGNLTIKDGTFNDSFRVETNSSFSSHFIVKGGTFNQSFSIEGGLFKEGFLIEGGKFNRGFRVWDGTFDGKFGITKGTFDDEFLISQGSFHKGMSVGNATFNKEFLIEGGTYKGEVNFGSGYIYRLTIWDIASAIKLRIEENCRINSLQFRSAIPKDSFIQLSGQFYSLTFNHVQNLGTIVPTKLSARKTPLYPNGKQPVIAKDDVFEQGRLLSYHDNTEKPQIRIDSSDLGKVIFMGCDLSGFGLHFDSSKITDVFVTGTKMPDKITTVDKHGNKDYQQRQVGYSQIKKIYEARGDRVEANRYYAKEMEAYLSTLSWWKWNDFWEKLNLNLNKYSTFHGQSWQRGLGTTLLISSLFYGVYCWILGYWPALPIDGNLDTFSHVASYFLEFVNPIHKADYVAEQLLGEKPKINGWARATEGISRVFIAYFVYQLIQAFRKHGKASG